MDFIVSTSPFSATKNKSENNTIKIQHLTSLSIATTTTMSVTNIDSNEDISSTDISNVQKEAFEIRSPTSTTSIPDDNDTDSSNYSSYIIPLKIILPVEHVHKSNTNDTFERFNYILLKVDDASYHEHIFSDNPDILVPFNVNQTTSKNISSIDVSITTTTESATDFVNTIDLDGSTSSDTEFETTDKAIPISELENDQVLMDSQGYRYELGKHYKITDDSAASIIEFDDIEMIRPKIETKPKSQTITKRVLNNADDDQLGSTTSDEYETHYARIFQWLHYHL